MSIRVHFVSGVIGRLEVMELLVEENNLNAFDSAAHIVAGVVFLLINSRSCRC